MAACGEEHPQCVPPAPWQLPVLADHPGNRGLASKPTEVEAERALDNIPLEKRKYFEKSSRKLTKVGKVFVGQFSSI